MKHKKKDNYFTRENWKEASEMYNIKPAKIDYTSFYIISLLIIIGSILRFYNLEFNSLWLDEIATYNNIAGDLPHVWASMSDRSIGYSPPLFFMLEWVVLQFTSVSEWSMRFIPAVFGVLTIPVMYLVGEKFYNKTVGWITAVVITFSPFLIFYSQEARPYSVLLFFCAVAFYFFLKAMESGNRNNWICFGIASAAAFYTHFYSMVFIGLLVIFAIAYRRKDIRNIGISLLVWILISLPIIITAASLYLYRYASAGSPTYGFRGLDVIINTLTQLNGYTAPIVFLSLFLAGIVWLYFKDREKVFLLGWLLGATLIISVVASDHIPMLPRYTIFLIIPLSLGIAGSYNLFASLVPTDIMRFAAATFLIACIIVIPFPYYQNYYTSYSKEDWKGISQDLASYTKDGDIIVIAPRYIEAPLNFYYSTENDRTIEVGIMSTEELLQVKNNLEKNQSIYYIVTGDISATDPSGKLMQLIQQNTQIIKQVTGVYILKGV